MDVDEDENNEVTKPQRLSLPLNCAFSYEIEMNSLKLLQENTEVVEGMLNAIGIPNCDSKVIITTIRNASFDQERPMIDEKSTPALFIDTNNEQQSKHTTNAANKQRQSFETSSLSLADMLTSPNKPCQEEKDQIQQKRKKDHGSHWAWVCACILLKKKNLKKTDK